MNKKMKELMKFLKNRYLLISIAGISIMAVSFVGDYYFYEIIKNLNLLNETFLIKEIIAKIQTISYIYIYLSVFAFLVIIMNIEQFFRSSQMKSIVYTDELSGLNNRNYYENVLMKKIKPKDYIAIMCDIDHFKKVNDTYGHDVGDDVIKYVGHSIKNSIRENEDFAVRYGGEEFLVLINTTLNNYTNKTIYDIFDRLHFKIKNKTFITQDKEFSITLSFGINCYIKHVKTLTENVKMADLALYHAKKERNLIVLYTEENRGNFGISYELLVNFILNNEFNIKFYPIIDLEKNIHYFNLDVRFKHLNILYNIKEFENLLKTNEELTENFVISCLNFLSKNYINNTLEHKFVFNITAKQLFISNILNHLIQNKELLSKHIILNVTLNESNLHILSDKLSKLETYELCLNDESNKDMIFSLLETNTIKYVLTYNKNIEFISFLNKISLSYGFNVIINQSFFFKKEELETINAIKLAYFKGE